MERLWRLFDRVPGGCWEWRGDTNDNGYARVSVAKEGGGRVTAAAHRVIYELLVHPIPEGMEIDHLCRNRACVNPAHLDLVGHRENCRRSPLITGATSLNSQKTYCKQGHAFDEANTYHYQGHRHCRACHREAETRRREERRARAQAV